MEIAPSDRLLRLGVMEVALMKLVLVKVRLSFSP